MLRIVLSTTAVLTLTAGLLVPASSQAVVSVTQSDPGDSDAQIVLAEFRSAKCKNRAVRIGGGFTAVAKANGWQLEVIAPNKPKRSQLLRYKQGITVRLDGLTGAFSSNIAPAAAAGRAAGALTFNRNRTRMGVGFSPMFASDFSSVDVGGGLTCKYPKKKRRARRSAAASAGTKTRITDTSVNPNDDGGNRISGVVVSARESCHNNRKVLLFKRKGSKRNVRRDKKIGSDRATPNGDGSQFRIDFEGSGKYYAYVKKSKRCGGAYSGVVSVSPEN